MGESQQLFLGLWLVSRIFEENQQSAIQTKIGQHFGGFFQLIKVRQPIGRKYSKHTVIPTSRRLDSFLYEAAQNFELLSNIQDQNLKKSKTYTLRLKSFLGPLRLIQSGRMVPLSVDIFS
jgi:hypothetical protein